MLCALFKKSLFMQYTWNSCYKIQSSFERKLYALKSYETSKFSKTLNGGWYGSWVKYESIFKCLLYRFSKYIPKSALRLIADACILSKLNYCCTVWGSALNRNSLDFLQILQNKVARLIVGCKIHEKSRKELHNWLTVRQRICMRTAIIIYRTLNCREPFIVFDGSSSSYYYPWTWDKICI